MLEEFDNLCYIVAKGQWYLHIFLKIIASFSISGGYNHQLIVA